MILYYTYDAFNAEVFEILNAFISAQPYNKN